MEQQNWEGKQLDKDIIRPGNKIYSPENCAFVSAAVNKFVTDSGKTRGAWPIGVYYRPDRHKFRAMVWRAGQKRHLGYFDTPEEAHLTWAKAKREQLDILIEQEQPPEIVANALIVKYEQILEHAVKACDGTQH